MGHFQAMKHWNAFFGHGVTVPILGGISRDYLSSEFSLYNILFYCLPPFAAYMCGYFLKILIAAGSVILLAKDIYREEYKKYEPAAVITGLIYGFCRCSLRMGLHSPQSPLPYCCSGAFTEGRAVGIICSFPVSAALLFSYSAFYSCLSGSGLIILAVRDYRRRKKETGFLQLEAGGMLEACCGSFLSFCRLYPV